LALEGLPGVMPYKINIFVTTAVRTSHPTHRMRSSLHYISIIKTSKSRGIRWEGSVTRMEKIRYGYEMLLTKPKLKRGLGEHRRKYGDKIILDIKGI
jgi:hypothetical protein